ncbi:hypothetical protein [uncultured Arsenicicoccus sp.]|uniref:hypothetical protein n=1 Tax=uncultured Arsenicicoccus sp. TaxID=491339 RepID=UPI002592A24B|nr:hypothetical protein [uncultured Arsenicicoccus sp.]
MADVDAPAGVVAAAIAQQRDQALDQTVAPTDNAPEAETSPEPRPEAETSPEPEQRPRRRRGRVVAPAGPPKAAEASGSAYEPSPATDA